MFAGSIPMWEIFGGVFHIRVRVRFRSRSTVRVK